MKWFHNATIGKFLAVGFAVAVHGMFALGAYYLGLFISSVILRDATFLVQPAAIGFAALTFAGAMWGFVYHEYAKEDVDAYSRNAGKNFNVYLYIVQGAIACDELASLAFRAYQVQDNFERSVIVLVGLMFLVIAYCLGKIIHAMANRPFEVAVYRARQQAGRNIVDDAMRYVPHMTTEQQIRFYNGDAGVIDEVRGRSREHDERMEDEQGRRRAQEAEEQGTIKGFTQNLLQPRFHDAQSREADRLSQNGRH